MTHQGAEVDQEKTMSNSWRPVKESELLEGLSIIHLKVFSLWDALNTYRSSGTRSKYLKFYIIFTIVLVLPYLFSQILCVFYIRINLQMVIYLILNTLPPYQAMLKMGVFWFRLQEECFLFDLLKEDFLTCIPHHKMSQAKEIYRRITKRCNVFCFLAFAANTITVITWIVMPGFESNLEGTGRKKIIAGWYPFPYSETPYYEVVVTYEAVMMVWFGLSLCPYECFLFQLLCGLFAHFSVLNQHLATLFADGRIKPKQGDEKYLNAELYKILMDYNKLLRYSDILKDVYNLFITIILGMVMTDLISSSLHLLFTPKDAMFTVNLIIFFIHSFVEITLICFCSSFVEGASSKIKFSAYSSDWYVADKEYRLTLQMMILRSQRPVTLIAVKMYPVNLETLIAILQFIYTTCTLLSKMK